MSADKAAACITRHCPGKLSHPCAMQAAMSISYTWHNCPCSAASFAQDLGPLATTEISVVGRLGSRCKSIKTTIGVYASHRPPWAHNKGYGHSHLTHKQQICSRGSLSQTTDPWTFHALRSGDGKTLCSDHDTNKQHMAQMDCTPWVVWVYA